MLILNAFNVNVHSSVLFAATWILRCLSLACGFVDASCFNSEYVLGFFGFRKCAKYVINTRRGIVST